MSAYQQDADGLTFSSVGPSGIVHYARCEPCMYGQHVYGWHPWAGAEDIEHAAKTGRPDPSNFRCACLCVDESPPEPPEVEVESLDVEPCPLCGEAGPCGYDAEGRPMVHTDVMDDDQ